MLSPLFYPLTCAPLLLLDNRQQTGGNQQAESHVLVVDGASLLAVGLHNPYLGTFAHRQPS